MASKPFLVTDIFNALTNAGLTLTPVYSNEFKVSHSLTALQFDAVVKAVVKEFELEPQNSQWFPGNPAEDETAEGFVSDEFGYYIQPINPDDWDDEGEFYMLISNNLVTWC